MDVIVLSDDEDVPILKPVSKSNGLKRSCKIALPSEEWYEMMDGPLYPDHNDIHHPTASSSSAKANQPPKTLNGISITNSVKVSNLKRKRKLKKKIHKSAAEEAPVKKIKLDCEVASTSTIKSHGSLQKFKVSSNNNNKTEPESESDGEDLLTVLPISSKKEQGNEECNEIIFLEEVTKEIKQEEDSPIKKSPKENNYGQSSEEEHLVGSRSLQCQVDRPFTKEVDCCALYGIGCTNADIGAAKKIAAYRKARDFKHFDNSIWRYLRTNLQNHHTFSWKMQIRKLLREHLRKVYPNCELVATGSTVNGCGTYNSDMDLCMCIPCPTRHYDTDKQYAAKNLQKAKRSLMRYMSAVVRRIDYIKAKVPILKMLFHPPHGQLEVDLNCNNVTGIYNSFLIHNYSRIDERFPALCLVVKHWAKSQKIGEAFLGYLNSYSLILLVLHFLQCGVHPPVLPNLQALYPHYFRAGRPINELVLCGDLPEPLPEITPNPASVGELLIGFFDYYKKFDFDSYAISIKRARIFPRSELESNTLHFCLFVEEPFDELNTARCVTSNSNWAKIADAISRARFALYESPELKKIGVQWNAPK